MNLFCRQFNRTVGRSRRVGGSSIECNRKAGLVIFFVTGHSRIGGQ
jgi:hypothetical protein